MTGISGQNGSYLAESYLSPAELHALQGDATKTRIELGLEAEVK